MSPTRAKHVEAAYENEAIETLLISDELFRWTTPPQLTTPLHYHLIYMTNTFLSIYYSFTFFFLSLFSFLLSFFYFHFSSFFLFSFFFSLFLLLSLSLSLSPLHARAHTPTNRQSQGHSSPQEVCEVGGRSEGQWRKRENLQLHARLRRTSANLFFISFFFCFLF